MSCRVKSFYLVRSALLLCLSFKSIITEEINCKIFQKYFTIFEQRNSITFEQCANSSELNFKLSFFKTKDYKEGQRSIFSTPSLRNFAARLPHFWRENCTCASRRPMVNWWRQNNSFFKSGWTGVMSQAIVDSKHMPTRKFGFSRAINYWDTGFQKINTLPCTCLLFFTRACMGNFGRLELNISSSKDCVDKKYCTYSNNGIPFTQL